MADDLPEKSPLRALLAAVHLGGLDPTGEATRLIDGFYEGLFVHAICLGALPDKAKLAVDDVVARFWLKIELGDVSDVTSIKKMEAYLKQAVRNALRQMWRRQVMEGRHEAEEQAAPDAGVELVPAVEIDLLRQDVRVVLEQALATCSIRERDVWWRHVLDGEKLADIAATLGIAVNTVKAHCYNVNLVVRDHFLRAGLGPDMGGAA